MLKISILTIGDEICIGQIVNTNASWMAQQCSRIGCDVLVHSSIHDDKEIIKNELSRLLEISDVVLVSGGLGPTSDDLTKPALCEFFDDVLVKNQDVLDFITEMFSKRGIAMLERNVQQAYVPSKCKVILNRLGTAPGMLFEQNGKYVISMPGVPAEMKNMFEKYVLNLLNELIELRNVDVLAFKVLQTIGIPESILAEKLGDPDDFISGGTLAFLPSYKGVKLRIGFAAKNFQTANRLIREAEDYIRSKVGKYIFASDEKSINEVVASLLVEKNMTVAVAESCTGGMLSANFTDVPGSSKYFLGSIVAYSNDVKTKFVNVDSEVIKQYGAVSRETVELLASNVRKVFGSDFGIGITGIAGPDGGSKEKPVGTVWIALADKENVYAEKFYLGTDRGIIRERAVATALNLLYKSLI
ncbi:MAG TPA: competence/damage-inducible protein A [Candidatus Kapabacteria bacterium]|nr:competence/damage-inducible protein A [Candidatus Kapabacteria bacterium]HPO62151.1 competence/damage-inducible protein A [Candidatus Kapabacteria bacterium]